MTRRWAVEAGLSDAEAEIVARACWDVDRVHPVREWRNKGYHFAWLGARRRARRLLVQAITHDDLVALGESLHCLQDAIGHGFWGHIVHWQGIDRWESRGEGVRRRLEEGSRRSLRRFVTQRVVAVDSRESGTGVATRGGSR